jgi:dATP pyrophosphohydrolase
MTKSLPVIIQNIIYRKKDGNFEVLLLKRTPERGGFWNVVNGTLELNESIVECKKRELMEEVGIQDGVHWNDEIYRFSFPYKDYVIVVIVFSTEVSETQRVIINDEHTEFRWVSFDEATDMLQFDDDKKGLKICKEKLAKGEI